MVRLHVVICNMTLRFCGKKKSTMASSSQTSTSDEKKNVRFAETSATIDQLMQKVESVKKILKDLYVPKHFDSMMAKIGRIESDVNKVSKTTSTCFNSICFILVFVLLVVVGVFCIIRKVNYWQTLCRIKNFGVYKVPRKSCRKCYFKPRGYSINEKRSFSAPELGYGSDYEV